MKDYPSTPAMKAAVELEIAKCLGFVQTVSIGQLIQKVIDATIEDCAKFVEQHQERISETSSGSERSLSPRMVGNQMGLAYVTGIRALSRSPQETTHD